MVYLSLILIKESIDNINYRDKFILYVEKNNKIRTFVEIVDKNKEPYYYVYCNIQFKGERWWRKL